MTEYLIEYESASIDEIIAKVRLTTGIPISELRIKDLVYYKNKPIKTGNGVYIFKNEEKVYYVGSCVARNFVERVPAHFDTRTNGWFNSLLKAIMKYDTPTHSKCESLEEAAEFAFKNINLVLVNFENYHKDKINNLERRVGVELQSINTRFRRFVEIL